jgi:hypothetical protein
MSKALISALALLCVFEAVAGDYKIIHVKGNVTVLRKSKSIPATKNFILEFEDKVSTSEKSLAVVKGTNLTFKVAENSQVSISELDKGVNIDIQRGGLVINLIKEKVLNLLHPKPKLQVRTAHAIMGVRGTTLFAYYLKDQTTYLTVKEGVVDFRGKNSVKSESVDGSRSTFTDSSLKNLKPTKVGFEDEINWELNDVNAEMGQPKKLFSKMEEKWSNYKKENENKMKDHKKNMNDDWEKYKNNM